MRPALIAIMFAVIVTGSAASQATPTTDYPPLDDVRDIWSRPWSLESEPFSIVGEVSWIRVAPEGDEHPVGDESYRTVIALDLLLPNVDNDTVIVGDDSDPVGINDGDTITVGGVLVGEYEGTARNGREWAWPLMAADYITEGDPAATPAS
jgi:hypothetical protein